MDHATAADRLADAVQQLAEGTSKTRPVSTTVPEPLLDALQALVEAGLIPSVSAATTEALTAWAYNRLLRFTLDEIYQEHPEARPSAAAVRAAAQELGLAPGDVRQGAA